MLFALAVREREGPVKAWESLCTFGMFHCGDSDSTGIISGAIWGAMFGFKAHKANYDNIEYKEKLLELGEKLYLKSEEILIKDPLISPSIDDSSVPTAKSTIEECTSTEIEGDLKPENNFMNNKETGPRETLL